MNEQDWKSEPPSPGDAAGRLLCLMCIGARAYFEGEMASAGTEVEKAEARTKTVDLVAWLEHEQVMPRLSAQERSLMDRPVGSWDERERVNGSWRAESAGVIAWSLKLLKQIPPYDSEFRPLDMMDVIPQTGEPTANFLNAASYRSDDEIDQAREIAEFWLWRSRTTRTQSERSKYTSPTPPEKCAEHIVSAAHTGEANGWFVAIDNDFPAFGKAYADMSPQEYRRATSIAQERLWGLNWICGYDRNWDEVPLDT
jgi:hypothetical protein